ncbi:DUF1566 domain-containing protein [bacterium]|nr:DUF1566 domain-containing protein [bacterium]MBP5434198.1 DUF1566 domain-containing protein [bacterium]
MKKIAAIFLCLSVLFQLFADDDEKLRLAVMEFEDLSGKLSQKMLSNATEEIRSMFVASNKFIIIAEERQKKAMLREMKEQSYDACNDKNCQIKLGQALSADTILRTKITYFDGTYTITSELIDLEKEATTQGANATFNGTERSLKEAINSIVAQIAGIKQQKESKPQNSQDEYACNYAKQKATISVWNQYLEDFPNGGCAELAHEEIDKMACEHAEKNNSIEAWELYLKHQSQGKCAFKAKAEIKGLKRAKEKEEQERQAAYLKGRKIGSLIWSDRSANEMNWSSAKQYCEDLTEGGYTDWRLPNIDELRTLLIADRVSNRCRVSERNNCLAEDCWSCSTCTQTGTQKSDGIGCSDWGTAYSDGRYSRLGDGKVWLWSSSTLSDDPNRAWGVSFRNGRVSSGYKSLNGYVRCVR